MTNSYSIVIETENLSLADSACLWACLDSVQSAIDRVAPPAEALLFNTGDISPSMVAMLEKRYPWVSLVNSPPGKNYYEIKMQGARLATADLVVFVDSDCRYNEDWLAGLLEPFVDPNIRVVAGETAFTDPGPYGLALAIAHSFDGFSGRSDLYPVNNYYANNVAFRRSVLLDLPIPTRLPLYRHGCSAHCVELRRRGEHIWAQPRSRAMHAAPEGIQHFFWRFLLFGRDRAVRSRIGLLDDAPKPGGGKSGVIAVVKMRLERSLKLQPAQRKWIPAASLIVLAAFVLIRTGQVLSRFRPQLAIDYFSTLENLDYPTIDDYKESILSGATSESGSSV